MGKIVAIGGGEINKRETLAIDQEIIRLSGKKHPSVLFIPTASSDAKEYVDDFIDYYCKHLSCKVDVMKLIKQNISTEEIRDKILSSDIVYVDGGNTLMMKLWRKLGVDKILEEAYEKNIVLCGISAGAICWFKFGNSDSRQFKNPAAPLIRVSGLGLLDGLLCPHYHSKKYAKGRADSLKKMMKRTPGKALAIDDFCAIAFVDDSYNVLTSSPGAHAYKVYWKRGKFYHDKIDILTGVTHVSGKVSHQS
ncbi:MAG: Peptidase E [candidate division TM6 bacterium GW2011_GWF2_37_49]|nr:MAG: Peptidase E [candidate division TM6 bacterium GW2011_GWF2_37_49]